MNKYTSVKNNVYCVGDIHGEFDGFIHYIKTHNMNDSVIIVCGDIGMGFHKLAYYDVALTKINNAAEKLNSDVYFFRGNHDDPSYFNGKEFILSNVKLIPDYSVIEVNGETPMNLLCVGGGISIDRSYRIVNRRNDIMVYSLYHPYASKEEAETNVPQTYWENEPPIFDPLLLDEIKENGINIDVVCAHSCPSFCDPTHKYGIEGWLERDEKLGEDIDSERKVMDSIYNKLLEDGHPLQKWFYGHFHRSNTEVINNVTFIMLNMNFEAKQILINK